MPLLWLVPTSIKKHMIFLPKRQLKISLRLGGLLMFIGAITIILFGLGVLLIIVSNIVLAIAFFKAPNEVEVQGA